VLLVHDGHAREAAGAIRNVPHRLVADVSLIVGVDDVLVGPHHCSERIAKIRPVRRRVHLQQRISTRLRVVDRPLQRQHALFARDERRNHHTMRRARHVHRCVVPSAHMDGLLFVLHRMPRAIGSLILVLPVHVLHIDVLRIAIERGKSPRHVLVVPATTSGESRPVTPATCSPGASRSFSYPDIRNLLSRCMSFDSICVPARRS